MENSKNYRSDETIKSSNLTLFQYYTIVTIPILYNTFPILQSSNPTLFQSYTLSIPHPSNPTLFQSFTLPILHSSNLTLFQSHTLPISHSFRFTLNYGFGRKKNCELFPSYFMSLTRHAILQYILKFCFYQLLHLYFDTYCIDKS